MNPDLELLGLDADADERAIKRAYAQLLRATRPDDDPDAFQALHQAYQSALQRARHRAQRDDDDETDAEPSVGVVGRDTDAAEPLSPASAATALEPSSQYDRRTGLDTMPVHFHPPMPAEAVLDHAEEPSLELQFFVRLVINTAIDTDSASFEHWLTLRPELWSLADKSRIGDAVLQLLLHQGGPLCGDTFDLLSRCFRWDEIGSDIDPYLIRARRNHLHRYWRLQPRNHAALVATLDRPENRVTAREAHARMERLTRPWHWLQSLLSACVPGRADTMRRTMEHLEIHDVRDTLPPVDADQVLFWMAVSQRGHVNLLKLQVAVLRGLLCALIVLLVLGALALLDAPSVLPSISISGIGDVAIYAVVILVFCILLLSSFVGWTPSRPAPVPPASKMGPADDEQAVCGHGPRPQDSACGRMAATYSNADRR